MRKLLLIGTAALAIGGGVAAVATAQANLGPRAETFHMLELFGDVLSIVERTYVVPVDNKKLIESALDGMMTALDPHSNYLSPDDFTAVRERTEGQYSGVGLEITTEGGLVKVISPIDDTPGSRAGVQAGDVISTIDGQNVTGKSIREVSEKLRGAMGTTVRVTFLRDGEEPREVVLTREVIHLKSVRERMEGEFGYVRIAGFNDNTGQELLDAVARLKAQNPGMRGLVLDLRNNGGGTLNAAIAVSDAFLERGEIVTQRGRRPEDIARYNATPGDVMAGLPIVVLTNYGSASASEIVAGALKDHERATIVGLTSFGKGSVQTVLPLQGGRDGALSLTTARYYTPSGRSIQKIGIEPDLEVARSAAEARIVARSSFVYSEAAYANALDASVGAERRGPHTPEESPPEGYAADKDYQLERALDLLRVGGVLSRLERRPTPAPAPETTTQTATESPPPTE